MSGHLIVMAGGTGGHVYPGLAVARAMRERGWRVSWVGTPNGMENQLVDAKEFPFKAIAFEGIVGRGLLPKLRLPFALMRAVGEAKRHFRAVKPDAVIGMGGYPSVPGGLAAWRMKIPLAIHQSDAIAGAANRLLARCANRILSGFAGTFAQTDARVVVTGNPIRHEFAQQPSVASRFGNRVGAIKILVMGGSRGASALNETVPKAIALLPAQLQPEIRHQCGAGAALTTQKSYRDAGVTALVEEFIGNSCLALAECDLFIGRSGASTVSEVAALGVPAIFVPYPHHADRQQLHNARTLERVGGAKVIEQSALTAQSLAAMIGSLDRETLLTMATQSEKLAQPDATARICDAIESMISPPRPSGAKS
jgi:UDP-N-acetylglucosamine--N-acetylmuramyl-(pentapeptide) pyrophosphoryl-undecaprenol N-acetylglucosamine transferase